MMDAATITAQLNAGIQSINALRISPAAKRARIDAAIAKANAMLAALKPITKRALLVGCNYVGTPNELYGCINDAKNIQNLLKTKCGFTDITLLTDETPTKPYKKNILSELQSLLQKTQSGDTAFFLFSGHGTCTADLNKDESDGQDELIVPLDATSLRNCILDDELNTLIRTYLKPGAKLLALVDSCFSGTVLDLRYTYGSEDQTKELETPGDIFMISGCTDQQTSADTVAPINGKDQPSGAMTYAFLNTVKPGSSQTLANLITEMDKMLKQNGYEQIPKLSSGRSVKYDIVSFL